MPTSGAILLTIVFIFALLIREARYISPWSSRALWLPLFWLLIVGARFPSQWLSLFGISTGSYSYDEGSPLDAAVFLFLISAGLIVLARRGITLRSVIRENAWISIFIIYCFIAIFWSDIPFVAAKRWFKTLGHPVMALIILTDPEPLAAFRTTMKRCGYVLLPLSVLFIKYLPQFGRGFDEWTGLAINRGINLNKNELGYVCLVFGMFFLWNELNRPTNDDSRNFRSERVLGFIFIAIDLWLLAKSASVTAAVALFVGSIVLLLLQIPAIRSRDFRVLVATAMLVGAVIEFSFSVDAPLISFLGRNESLTDRTAVWHDALSLSNSPIFGAGFESFWSGRRLELLWAKWWWHPNQAHDGYLETYLNLGSVGVVALLGLIIATFLKIARRINSQETFARFRMGFLLTVLVYNFTEATFKGVALVWTIFNLIAIDPPSEALADTLLTADAVVEPAEQVDAGELATTIEA